MRDLHRLAVLHDLEILDTPPELAYDEIAAAAARATGSAIAAVNFVDGDRHWTKAAVGVDAGHAAEVPSELSFCAATVRSGRDLLVVPDTLAGSVWREHPLVLGPPHLRFYAGAVVAVSRQPVGVVCIYGDEPRPISRHDERALLGLAGQLAGQLERRHRDRRLRTPALTDPLTGVANRRLLVDRLECAIAERRRHHDELGVVRCRVDAARRERPELADRLLVGVADGLVNGTDRGDTVARAAPDEFVVVLPGLVDADDLHARVTRLRANLPAADRHADAGDEGDEVAEPALWSTLVRDGESAASVLLRAADGRDPTAPVTGEQRLGSGP